MRLKNLFRQLTLMASLMMSSGIMAQWIPAGDRIRTSWSETIKTDNVLSEYPRPIMERDEWKCLNGLWDYAIRPATEKEPATYDGKILVPFAVESSLSGVGRLLGVDSALWYRTELEIPKGWSGKRILLNFGAVDWEMSAWVNGVNIGGHTGGFSPFSLEATSALKPGKNILVVKVLDPTDKGEQPRGKQVSDPKGIWYTPVSGIWQTVWMEPVEENYIESLRITPDIDNRNLKIEARTEKASYKDRLNVKVIKNGQVVAEGTSINGLPVNVSMPSDLKLWSPSSPELYDLEISFTTDGKVTDKVRSYAAMRKFSTRRDSNGIMRIQLNNQDLFQFGPLDQGWWPDGLYTAPSDEALKFDIQMTKDMGFNMIRKHIKVEPARWYTWCDKIGIIVWQDMPSGDKNPQWQNKKYFVGTEYKRSDFSEKTYRKEWKEIIDALYSYPCIGTWVPFNEAWGQFKSVEIAKWTKDYDPTRLVNPASGGNHYTCGDILDLHNYPAPDMYLYDAQRVNVLGEYGGIGLVVKNHIWDAEKRNWGYIQFNSKEDVTAEYENYAHKLYDLINKGFSAAVYTQTTDVEGEVNGLMTYDRKIIKMDMPRIRQINQKICESLNNK